MNRVTKPFVLAFAGMMAFLTLYARSHDYKVGLDFNRYGEGAAESIAAVFVMGIIGWEIFKDITRR